MTHPLRVIVDHHIILISGLLGTESGDRNRKRYPQFWQGSLVRRNASSSDRGKTTIFNNRHDATSCKFPERRLRNVVTPEGLPSRDGRPVNTKQRRKHVDPARRWTLPHGADQNHDSTEVDLSAEKTDRWRRHPLPAAVAIAAEAEPAAILLRLQEDPWRIAFRDSQAIVKPTHETYAETTFTMPIQETRAQL
jgi:hypothetical protein